MVFVNNKDCETCDLYKSKYVEYPIEVCSINCAPMEPYNQRGAGSLVRIAPCTKEYDGKTFLRMYLGDLPCFNHISYNEGSKGLTVSPVNNPAI